jgi:hypothetical protein
MSLNGEKIELFTPKRENVLFVNFQFDISIRNLCRICVVAMAVEMVS